MTWLKANFEKGILQHPPEKTNYSMNPCTVKDEVGNLMLQYIPNHITF
jgi:hypothetical protein